MPTIRYIVSKSSQMRSGIVCCALLAGSAQLNVHLENQWQYNVELYIHLYCMHKQTSKLNNLYCTVMDECNHCELMYV